MNLHPVILLCTSDEGVIRQVNAAMSGSARVVAVATIPEAEDLIHLEDPAALVLDIRVDGALDHLPAWLNAYPDLPILVLGRQRSEPMLDASRFDVFASADPEDDYRVWRERLTLALKHRRALVAARDARAAPSSPPPPAPLPERPPAREGPAMMTRLASAFRHFDNLDLMLDRAIEELAAAAHTTRAGLFARDDISGGYRLRAGLRTLKETAGAVYEPRDPLVRWFERNAHMVTRALVGQVGDPAQRRLLERSLDLAGAEVMVPMHARGQLLGWIFVGHQSTGQSFTLGDLQDLSVAADYVSMLLENALLYREVAVQKTLAETLLHALPTGIIAVDGAGAIRWISTAAEPMFHQKPAEVIGHPVERMGSRLADAMRRALAGGESPSTRTWEEPASRRVLQVEVRRLGAATELLGAVAIVQDITALRQMQEQQAQLERSAFWADLAAGLSHEIRNPLVAIRTFAQLLPERYQEEDFRQEFSGLVAREVERLDAIIQQINDFAHPVEPVRANVDVRLLLREALARAFPETPPRIAVKADLDGHLPLVQGDERALVDCFYHLFQNAAEALDGKSGGSVRFAAHAGEGAGHVPVVRITVHDNGRGIPAEALDKVFSPFYTTKARGMGLGLPIVQRTVIDHHGSVRIDSGETGTDVVIELPALAPAGSGGGT